MCPRQELLLQVPMQADAGGKDVAMGLRSPGTSCSAGSSARPWGKSLRSSEIPDQAETILALGPGAVKLHQHSSSTKTSGTATLLWDQAVPTAEDLEQVCANAILSRKSKAWQSPSCLNCTEILYRRWIELALLFICVLFLLLNTKPFSFPFCCFQDCSFCRTWMSSSL